MKSSRIRKTLAGLEGDIVEIKATHSLAAGLSNVGPLSKRYMAAHQWRQLYALLTYLNYIPDPFHVAYFSKAHYAFEQRVKTFLSLKDPPCPSFSDISSLITLRHNAASPDSAAALKDIDSSSARTKSLAILSLAESELQSARQFWAQRLRTNPEQARCRGSGARWKKDVQAVFKSAVGAGVVCATLRKRLEQQPSPSESQMHAQHSELRHAFEVKIPSSIERWHRVWVIPEVKIK